MGFTTYCSDTRALRATSMAYATADVNVTFVQQKERRVHAEMDSKKIAFRECRDSEVHPNAIPIILALDVTGSMGDIPRQLIADGLPTLMSKLIQNGVPDAALLFLAIGDHECDRYPVQAAQFESGDAELDMWLTRTYLEGGGGGNAGESYPLAWEFAANRVKTDAWDKRKQKGFLITIGDEPFLKTFPANAFNEIYGGNGLRQETASAAALYAEACEKFNVFHISYTHGNTRSGDAARPANSAWAQLMGKNHTEIGDHQDIPNAIANLIVANMSKEKPAKAKKSKEAVTPSEVADTVSPML